MKALILLAILLWAAPSWAAKCRPNVNDPAVVFDEDGCQTVSVSNPQGDWQILSFHLCDQKDNGDLTCDTAGFPADPDFDMVADAAGIPQRVQFSLDNESTCTAGTVTIIGRNISGGEDHTIDTLSVGGVNSLIISEWRHQFVTATIAGLVGCVADSFDVGMRLYYRKITR